MTWPQLEKADRPRRQRGQRDLPADRFGDRGRRDQRQERRRLRRHRRAKFIPVESGSFNTIEGTTGSAGCVVLIGHPGHRSDGRNRRTHRLRDDRRRTRKCRPRHSRSRRTSRPTTSSSTPKRAASRPTSRTKANPPGKAKKSSATRSSPSRAKKWAPNPKYEVGSTTFAYEKTGEEHFTPLLGVCSTAATCEATFTHYGATAYTAAGSQIPQRRPVPVQGRLARLRGRLRSEQHRRRSRGRREDRAGRDERRDGQRQRAALLHRS